MSREKIEERQGSFERCDTGCMLNEGVKIERKGYLARGRYISRLYSVY